MGVYNRPTDDTQEADIIIAGGGTAGCVVAGRLAAADPNLKILIIEGGTNNDGVENVVHPALFPEHLAEGSKTAIFYQANKSKELAGREPIVPSGGILGGGSSINLMLYTRGQRSDFDSFNTPGWSADEILPYLKKLETYHGRGDEKHHGYDGPTHVSDGGFRVLRSENDFIQAAERVGYPEIEDLQNLDANNGVQRWMRYVSPDGKRQDAAHVYVHPLMRDGKHPNLKILVEQKIVRVLFDENKKACGVEYQPNPHYHPNSTEKSVAKAKKMVIVSCGACGSPSVLERSGVGNPEYLKKAGVSVVADVPGVGHDYQDHNLVFFPFKTYLDPGETTDALMSGRMERKQAISDKEKILGWNTCDVSAKLRPTDAEVEALGPEFKKMYEKNFKDPNRPMMLMSLVSSYLGADTTIEPGQYASLAQFTAYPFSRGHIHITGPEVMDPLDFEIGFLTDPNDNDLKKQIWAYKKAREIMRRTEMYRGEVPSGHPRFDPNSKAAIVDLGPKEQRKANGNENAWKDVQDIEYTTEDEKVMEQFFRERIETTWHSLGTAKMAPLEEKGAIDANLNVYGVKGLKVCDLSIVPQNVAANTMNTALVVGEKGADIVAKELGLEPGYLAPSKY